MKQTSVEIYKWFQFLVPMGALLIAGCVTAAIPQWSTPALINSVAQRELADHHRLIVIDEVLLRTLDPNQHDMLGQSFARVVASSLHSPVIRSKVLEVINSRYRTEAPRWLGRALLNTRENEIRLQLIQALVNLHDKSSLPFLVIALAPDNGISPQTRELEKAIETIAEKPLEKVLIAQLASAGPLSARIAALASLHRIKGRQRTLETIMNIEQTDVVLDQLRFWASHFGYVPTNMMRFFLCRLQQMSLSSEQLQKIRRRADILKERRGYIFDARDCHILLALDDSLIKRNRRDLTGPIARRLASLDHSQRPPSYPGAPDDYDESFVDQCNLLGYTDLLRIKLLLDALAQPATTQQIRSFLRQDFNDNTTEIGGLCFLEKGKVVLKKYPPGSRRGDNQYIESPDLMQAAALCLARWHCHTDQWRTWELAGPGRDDIRYAHQQNCPVVVITHLDEKIFNVDYLTPQAVVIDLGCY